MTLGFRKTLVPAIAALVAAAGIVSLSSNAEAGWRGARTGVSGGFGQHQAFRPAPRAGFAHQRWGYRNNGWRGGAVAAGVIGGLALGSIAAHAARPQYYEPSYVSEPDYGTCFYEKRPVHDSWGNYVGNRAIRVCR